MWSKLIYSQDSKKACKAGVEHRIETKLIALLWPHAPYVLPPLRDLTASSLKRLNQQALGNMGALKLGYRINKKCAVLKVRSRLLCFKPAPRPLVVVHNKQETGGSFSWETELPQREELYHFGESAIGIVGLLLSHSILLSHSVTAKATCLGK